MSIKNRFFAWYSKSYPYLIGVVALSTVLLIFFWNNTVISIYSGERGVKYSRFFDGTVLDRSFGEGLYLIWPFDIMYIYDTRIIEISEKAFMPTKNGMMVQVDISCQYQVDVNRLPQLHQQIGPDYREKIVYPMLRSVVRQVIGSYSAENLYATARNVLEDDMVVRAITSLGRLPITVHRFIIEGFSFPVAFNEAIVKKMVSFQDLERYTYLNEIEVAEAKRKYIEGLGINKYQELINSGLTPNFLRFEGVRATRDLAASQNAKLVVVGGGKDGLPVILNTNDNAVSTQSSHEPSLFAPASKSADDNQAESTVQSPTSDAQKNIEPNMAVQVTQKERAAWEGFLQDIENALTQVIVPGANSEQKTP